MEKKTHLISLNVVLRDRLEFSCRDGGKEAKKNEQTSSQLDCACAKEKEGRETDLSRMGMSKAVTP